MIKKLLFITAIFVGGYASAQTFELLDENNVNIDGMTIERAGTAASISETKFHVQNVSNNSAVYSCKVYEVTNVPGSDLQVCYGVACFTATAGVSGAQTNTGYLSLLANQIDNTFKVAPFAFGWSSGDEATWRVVVYDTANVQDSTFAIVKWKVQGVSVDEIAANDVNFSAYPNPATNVLNLDYNFKTNVNVATVDVFDIVGKKVMSHQLNEQKATLKVDVSSLNAGVYFYTINADGKAIKTERVSIR